MPYGTPVSINTAIDPDTGKARPVQPTPTSKYTPDAPYPNTSGGTNLDSWRTLGPWSVPYGGGTSTRGTELPNTGTSSTPVKINPVIDPDTGRVRPVAPTPTSKYGTGDSYADYLKNNPPGGNIGGTLGTATTPVGKYGPNLGSYGILSGDDPSYNKGWQSPGGSYLLPVNRATDPLPSWYKNTMSNDEVLAKMNSERDANSTGDPVYAIDDPQMNKARTNITSSGTIPETKPLSLGRAVPQGNYSTMPTPTGAGPTTTTTGNATGVYGKTPYTGDNNMNYGLNLGDHNTFAGLIALLHQQYPGIFSTSEGAKLAQYLAQALGGSGATSGDTGTTEETSNLSTNNPLTSYYKAGVA